MMLWQYFVPLIIFAVAYWKILGVVRRQAKVAAGRHKSAAARTVETVAETSMIAVEQANVGSTERQRNRKGIVTTGSQVNQEVGGQNKPMNIVMSRAQINVVKTMIYITVFFTLCWMPMYLYYLLSTFDVGIINFIGRSSFVWFLLCDKYKIQLFHC